jgi:hypothetical protein
LPGQADLAAALLAPERAAPAGLAPQARLAVYRNNVVVSLTDALAAAYPAVLALVGERFFKAAAGVYVRAEPPRSPVLITYGQSFAQFLEGFAPAAKLPFLADVARLERLWLEAYHAADAAPQPIEGLGPIPEADLPATRITLHPSARLLRSRWPVASVWAANTGRGAHDAVDLQRSEAVLVIRPHQTVHVHVVTLGLLALLEALQAGQPLAAAADTGSRADDTFDMAAGIRSLFELEAAAGICPP